VVFPQSDRIRRYLRPESYFSTQPLTGVSVAFDAVGGSSTGPRAMAARMFFPKSGPKFRRSSVSTVTLDVDNAQPTPVTRRSRSLASRRAPSIYASRTEISCISPQQGQCTVSFARQHALRLATSVSMPVGACRLVLGQRKRALPSCASLVGHRRERNRSLSHRRLRAMPLPVMWNNAGEFNRDGTILAAWRTNKMIRRNEPPVDLRVANVELIHNLICELVLIW
jgi:hypothetical protein